jgi:hypothetical protein
MKKIFSISLLDLPSSFFAQATKIKIDVDRIIIAMFEEKKIILKPYIVSGGHTWMNCKLYLATTLQEIFH